MPLARTLASRGLEVRGSTTSEEKMDAIRDAGAIPHRLTLADTGIQGDATGFFSADWLIITVPPSGVEAYGRSIGALARQAVAGGTQKILFTSSTSVYPNLNQTVSEEDAGAPAGQQLGRNGDAVLDAERRLAACGAPVTVLRLAGLFGYDRHPARYMAGRQNIPAGDAPVNLVHQDDVIGAILAILEAGAGGTYNVVAPGHPSRRDVYTAEAIRRGLEPPQFLHGMGEWKQVSGAKLTRATGYDYRHPDPLAPSP
jgi:nucleoside-diphosphate-sugar epimerase